MNGLITAAQLLTNGLTQLALHIGLNANGFSRIQLRSLVARIGIVLAQFLITHYKLKPDDLKHAAQELAGALADSLLHVAEDYIRNSLQDHQNK